MVVEQSTIELLGKKMDKVTQNRVIQTINKHTHTHTHAFLKEYKGMSNPRNPPHPE